jgi:hypothetical protein
VLDDALTHLKGKIQTAELRVSFLEQIYNAEGVQIVFERFAKHAHLTIKLLFAHMTERRMTQIMCQGQSLGVLVVKRQSHGHGACHLRHFNGVSQAIAGMIVRADREDLSFALQTAECARMNNTISIALKIVAVWMGQLRKSAPTQTLSTKAQMAQHG